MSRARANDDGGFALIEVLVSAVVIVLAALGTFGALSYASRTSGSERSRTVAGALAQQDQESLRSLSPSALSALATTPRTSTSTVAGTVYTTTTTATWADDQQTSSACNGSVSSARYLKIISKVTWPAMTKAVTISSLISAPSGGGTLAAQIWDASKNPLSGIQVSLTGPRNATASTSAGGCVEWDYLPAGTYTLSFSSNGYVSPQGQQAVSQTTTVTDGTTNTLTFDYDRAGSLAVSFWSRNSVTSGFGWSQTTTNYDYVAPTAPQQDDRITLSGGGLTAPRLFGASGSFVNSIATTGDGSPASIGLFPSTSNYSVYAGDCGDEDPATYSLASDAQAEPTVRVQPGVFNTPVSVRLPMVDLTVQQQTSSSTTLVNGATVLLSKAAGTHGCPAATITRTTAADPVRGGNGKLAFPGLPFGSYTACVSMNDTATPTPKAHKATATFTLNSWSVPSVTLTVDTRTTTTTNYGTCP